MLLIFLMSTILCWFCREWDIPFVSVPAQEEFNLFGLIDEEYTEMINSAGQYVSPDMVFTDLVVHNVYVALSSILSPVFVGLSLN